MPSFINTTFFYAGYRPYALRKIIGNTPKNTNCLVCGFITNSGNPPGDNQYFSKVQTLKNIDCQVGEFPLSQKDAMGVVGGISQVVFFIHRAYAFKQAALVSKCKGI